MILMRFLCEIAIKIMRKRKYILLILLLTTFIICCKKEEMNVAPVADFIISPREGNIDSLFIFEASFCSDKEDEVGQLVIRWDWETDGIWDTEFSAEKTISHQFSSEGLYYVSLEVKDTEGIMASLTKQVAITLGGLFTDARDNRVYSYVKIGNQIWMNENLAWLPEVYKPDEGSIFDAYYYVYLYSGTDVSEAKNTDNYKKYGVLYNLIAARVSCPDGWHLPSDKEWDMLIYYIGGDNIASAKMKESGTEHWNSPNTGTIENCGYSFYALPGGRRDKGGYFDYIGYFAFFWSNSGYKDPNTIALRYDSSELFKYYNTRDFGRSVRCVKD